MSIKSLQIGLLGLLLCVASAWASSIQGIVKDASGQPVRGAEIRVEPRNGGQVLATTKTDANGRYATANLPTGVYRVSLVVNGAIKSSINNTQAKANKPTQLNFQLAGAAQKTVTKKGKHYVWVPSDTGSHLGGRWVEVDEDSTSAAGATNSTTVNAEELQRAIHDMRPTKPTGP